MVRRPELRHNSILLFIGATTFDQRTIIVSTYVENGNLLEYFAKHNMQSRGRLLLQVVEAVRFLHKTADTIHGDLKCENVLVTRDENAVLADFGLSTMIEKTDPAITATNIRNAGTFEFSAPELVDDAVTEGHEKRSKSRKTDVYAIGMLIIQAFTCARPWPKFSPAGIVMASLRPGLQGYPRPANLLPLIGMNDRWWNLCCLCCAPDADHRPTMEDVVEMLVCCIPCICKTSRSGLNAVVSLTCVSPPNTVASYSMDNVIRLLDLESGTQTVLPLRAEVGRICCIVVSPDGRFVYSSGEDGTGTLLRWRLSTDESCYTLIGQPSNGHKASISSLALGRDGRRVVSGSSDRTLRLWSTSSGSPVTRPLKAHRDAVLSVAMSHDNTRIASGSEDATVRFWHATGDTGEHQGRVQNGQAVGCVVFSPNANHLVACAVGTTVRLLNINEGQYEWKAHGHAQNVVALAFSKSGDHLASSSMDGTVRLWRAQTGEPVGSPLEHKTPVLSLTFARDDRAVLAGCQDGVIYVWSLFE